MDEKTIILTCSNCNAKNRVPFSRLAEKPVCGKCRSPLEADAMGKVVHVTDHSFDKVVMGSYLPVLLDCWAPWCGPCQAVGPVLDQLAAKYKARMTIAKLNVDENQMIAQRYSVSSIPTMLVIKNGQVVETKVGALPKEHLESLIEKHI